MLAPEIYHGNKLLKTLYFPSEYIFVKYKRYGPQKVMISCTYVWTNPDKILIYIAHPNLIIYSVFIIRRFVNPVSTPNYS